MWDIWVEKGPPVPCLWCKYQRLIKVSEKTGEVIKFTPNSTGVNVHILKEGDKPSRLNMFITYPFIPTKCTCEEGGDK